MDFSLCFVCPARYCEIIDDTTYSATFLKNLISLALDSTLWSAIADTVILRYSQKERMYYLQVHIHCHWLFDDVSAPAQETKSR
jgi:hypothetical protein